MREYLNKELSFAVERIAWDEVSKNVEKAVYRKTTYSRRPFIIRSFIHLAIQGETLQFNILPLDPIHTSYS